MKKGQVYIFKKVRYCDRFIRFCLKTVFEGLFQKIWRKSLAERKQQKKAGQNRAIVLNFHSR